ncbi:si:rp71-46j2.7 [Pimephales promelas]|nr:si:rp71-46j2.7 [Pimephales promelas]KAG1954575.1 si:rp71-46j2.7 [Pimephales promelas]
MYTWQCFLAIIFVLVWYSSEFGQIWTQAFFCFLCFLNFPFKKQDRETSTQTDDTPEETARQAKRDHNVGAIDETDATRTGQIVSQTKQYPNVQMSLLRVFKCAYTHLIQPWYTVPELADSQPLYRALQEEYSIVVEKIICKAKNFDLSAISVGCIRIFTHHLHNAKQSDSSPMFSSRSEEMAVLRTFSEALVRNLFPEYLWEAKLYQSVLTEIVATKALDVLVTYLCNPDNLNQMVVLQLDRVTPKSSIGDLVNLKREGTPSSMGSEEAEELTDEAEDGQSEDIKGKKKGNRIKEQFSKFVDKVKLKKSKKNKRKKELFQRASSARRPAVIEDDGASSTEGSIKSGLDYYYDSETDVYLTTVQEDLMEFKLSYEMWRVGKWAVHVTDVQKESEELCFTVHLEEQNNPENLHWDVKKTQSDILHFCSLLQESSALPSISAIVENTKEELDDAYTEEVRSAFEHFLQELVSDAQLGHTQPVFQFLGPFAGLLSDKEHEGGVWSLLNGLASFLTPSHDEEESHNCRGEDKIEAETGASRHHNAPTAQQACIETVEEPKGGVVEGPMATIVRFCNPDEETDPFRSKEPDIQDNDQIFDDADVVCDGQDSLAESLDIFVNRSKLVIPTVYSNDVSSSVMNHTEGLQSNPVDGFRIAQYGVKTNKKEKLTHKKLNGSHKFKVKEKTGQFKDEMTNQPQKKEPQTNWEQVEATKAIFDLLKEITGNSVLINIVDAILKPVQPLVKK